MARRFAERMHEAGGNDPRQQISKGYEMAMYRPINNEKLEALMKLYNQALQEFTKDKSKACEMNGDDMRETNPEKAALVLVANAMMNLDEFITKKLDLPHRNIKDIEKVVEICAE